VKAITWKTFQLAQPPRDAPADPRKSSPVNVHDRLRTLGVSPGRISDAEALLARFMPLDRPAEVTDEVLAAACAGDHVLVASLLAPLSPVEEDESAALRELDDGPAADRERIPLEPS
jgi:hypothetical protein